VAGDRELRSRLHWDNGTLAAKGSAVFAVDLDWPADVNVTCPVRGGFGLFLNEIIANAVRHGVPGTTPRLIVTCDRVRSELLFRVENAAAAANTTPAAPNPYGGLAIVTAMARLFEWTDLQFDRENTRFVASWSVPFSTRQPTQAD
jgi:two-component sensor histidine kinase